MAVVVSDLNPLLEGDEKGDDEMEELHGGKSGKPASKGKPYVHTEVRHNDK